MVALVSSTIAEPPSYSYGPPSISPGYSYEPHQAGTEYIEQHVGHQTSEGLNLDSNLLHKIEQILIQQENSGKGAINGPSVAYGVPQDTYGPPIHWKPSTNVVGIYFDHLRQSIPVAQYLGIDKIISTGYASKPTSTYGVPSVSQGWTLTVPKPPAPSSKYGPPSSRW
mgnify:CR=1 FL=1